MKATTLSLFTLLLAAMLLNACTAQRRFSSRLKGEWRIARFEEQSHTGSSSVLENAGTISFGKRGEGYQTFTSALTLGGAPAAGSFTWQHTAQTVSIKGVADAYFKVWMVMESKRNRQHWRSTDSFGNVQVLDLERKRE